MINVFFSSMVLMVMLSLTKAVDDHDNPTCTNTSTWGPIIWKDSPEPCCLTKIIEPDCKNTTEEVCVTFNETSCKIETWEECTMSPCPVQVTIPVHVPLTYTPWSCHQIWTNVTHHKKRPKEVEKTKEECDSIWIMNDDGEKVFGGEENCRTITWKDYEFEWYEVTVPTKESNCTQHKPFEYVTCENTTETSEQMCTNCEAKALPKCKTTTRTECEKVVVKTCKPNYITDCDWHFKVPMQDFKHKKRCFGEHKKEEDNEKEEEDKEDGTILDLRSSFTEEEQTARNEEELKHLYEMDDLALSDVIFTEIPQK